MYADGTPFFLMGDTHWTGFLYRSFEDGTSKAIVNQISLQGFNRLLK